ncbi:MAG TPA: aminotransferase class V-fold PLP-dependent enzyme [Acetobacteraceae bacterium]|nr:aminotransferase class V-fold PLP-dependent enzyme [Acetobacteraceae bacterium]
MTEPTSYKAHFSRALTAGGGKLHLAAHSHHLWPDVSFDAQMRAWQDAAALWDDKWSYVFGTLMPGLQQKLAGLLSLPDPAAIAFAPSTHDFVLRLLSTLPTDRPARILTTDSEFHSFSRQAARLAEDGLVIVTSVPTQPFADFPARFAAAAAAKHDLVYLSHVFFNSGFVVPDLAALVAAVRDPETLIVIDGYHGFLALPTDLSKIAARAFYTSGGYKYAMAGEGACFLVCPPDMAPRPRDTGWFAAFGALSAPPGSTVAYAPGGQRFMGATYDPTGLYRLHASLSLLEQLGLNASQIHARVRALQQAFIGALEASAIEGLRAANLVLPGDAPDRGNFLAYRTARAPEYYGKLTTAGIVTDLRADILRIGFGLYHDLADIPEIAARVTTALLTTDS